MRIPKTNYQRIMRYRKTLNLEKTWLLLDSSALLWSGQALNGRGIWEDSYCFASRIPNVGARMSLSLKSLAQSDDWRSYTQIKFAYPCLVPSGEQRSGSLVREGGSSPILLHYKHRFFISRGSKTVRTLSLRQDERHPQEQGRLAKRTTP